MKSRMMYLGAVLFLLLFGLWLRFFRWESLPFSDLIWREGSPYLRKGSEWQEWISAGGIPMETLREKAIAKWGPAYQDHFAAHFWHLMQEAGAAPGLWTTLGLKNGAGQRAFRQFNTPARWKACGRAFQERRKITTWRAFPPAKNNLPLLDAPAGRRKGEWLTAGQALEDLYTLRWLLQNRYGYPERISGTEGHFSALKSALKPGISRRDFAFQVQALLAGLQDIHGQVAFGRSGIPVSDKNLPFDLEWVGDRFFCLQPDEHVFLDDDYPFLLSLEGVGMEELFRTAQRLGGDPLSWMHRIDLLLRFHGRAPDGRLRVVLGSPYGTEKAIELPQAVRPPDPRMNLRVQAEKKDRWGYLKLSRGLYADRLYPREIIQAMYGLQHTEGLILDLRGNAGGARDAIPLLLHYFIPPTAHPLVLNIGRYKMAVTLRPSPAVELLRDRQLWSEDWKGWTPAQKRAISRWKAAGPLLSPFAPEDYSPPHFMVTDSVMPAGAYYYPRPVVILTDRRTASAAELLIANLKGRPNLCILGENSTGGSGYPLPHVLPHSRIQIVLSSMRSYLPDGRLVTYTVPDIPRREEGRIKEGRDGLVEQAVHYLDSLTRGVQGISHFGPG